MPRKRFRLPRAARRRPAVPPLVVDVDGRGPTEVPRRVAARLRALYPGDESLTRAFTDGRIYFCHCCHRFRCVDDPALGG